MQLTKRIAGAAATGALLCGGLFATAFPASAAPTDASDDEKSSAQVRTVTTWTRGPLRELPHSGTELQYKVDANTVLQARCWVYGQNITRYGITNDVWVKVGNPVDGSAWPYIWAGLLKGDKYGNLPASNRC